MKLVSFGPSGKERPGVLMGSRILDLCAADPTLPATVRDMLERGLLPRAANLMQSAGSGPAGNFVNLDAVRLGPPIVNPSKIICLGLNYSDHAKEQGKEVPERPLLFAKAPSCLCGNRDPVAMPPEVTQLDHEVELAFVIGRRAKNVAHHDAPAYIAGYGVFMDLSARDVQFREKQWFRGKSFDGFGPFGPYLTTSDEIRDPHDLAISLEVDGVTVQSSNTGNMRFRVDYLVHYLSHSMTLEPGDIVSTGTPAGVGVFANPQRFLRPGQRLRAAIDSLGSLENRIV
ncbi:MAG: fumarylacetoacetate hydrolase family protein [Chitinivibrionia bacterium]|nr:fumarylacetoacetate hydrolase family protein [Chitinivibrionia bacterium]